MGYFAAFKKKDHLDEGWLKPAIISAILLSGGKADIAIAALNSPAARQLSIKIVDTLKTPDGKQKYDIMVNKDNINKAKAFIKRLGLNVQGQG